MKKFLLVLYFGNNTDDDQLLSHELDALDGGYIEKMMENMPTIPRIGETISLGGNCVHVTTVDHEIKKRLVEVGCEVTLFSSVTAYAEDKEGWDLTHLSTEGKELFLERVNIYEASQEQE